MFAQSIFALAAATFLPLVSSESASISPSAGNGVSYAVTVPQSTTSTTSGPIYFQISGPSSGVSWIGFGQSNSGNMAGANLFVLYASANGKNVTLSPRHGLGEFQPKHDTSTKATLLDGSGIADGKMTANVRCDSCLSWDGGTLNPTDSQSKWIWSMRKGDALNSDDLEQNIIQHSVYGDFMLDLTKAVDTTGAANPFAATENTSGGSVSSGSTSSAGGSSNSAATEGTESSSVPDSYVIAHGVLMASALVIIMPFGALLKRLGTGKRRALISNPLHPDNRFRSLPHALVELFGAIEIIAGLGLGVYVGRQKSLIGKQAHTVLGLIIFSLVILQAFGGIMAYWLFSKNRPTFVGRIHQWQGRLIFLLGIINGGLGVQLVGENPKSATIAYAVVAGVAGLVYVAIILKWYAQRRKTRAAERHAVSGEKLPGDAATGVYR